MSTSNWTMPAHASMFTGGLPRALGLSRPLRGPDGGLMNPRPVLQAHAGRFLPAALRRAGYATAAASTNPWISARNGFAIGFERFADVVPPGRPRADGPWSERARWAAAALRPRADNGAAAAWDVVGGWLAQRPRRPFFWFVNLMECHTPYLPPAPYDALGPRERLAAARDAARFQTALAIFRYCVGELEIPEESLERMRYLYARSARLMDDWIARLLDALDRTGALDDTLVVITSDHGENLGEGHLIGHALSLDQRLVGVPLVVAGPGAPEPKPLLSLAGLPRLLANAAGIDIDGWPEDRLVEGAAIAQNDGTRFWSEAETHELATAWGVPREVLDHVVPMEAATDGRFKLISHGDEEHLFDLEADPLEQHDVTSEHPEVRDRLRAALAAADARGDAPPPRPEPYTPEEQAAVETRLRDLGYL